MTSRELRSLVLQQPHDLLLRRAYADALEDEGHNIRAMFIHASVDARSSGPFFF